EDLRRRLLELGEDEAAELDVQAVDLGGVALDLHTDLLAPLPLDVVGQLDVRVGDLSRALALGRHKWLAALGVGALVTDDVDVGGDLGEELLHGRLHLGVVDPLVGLEDAGPDDAGALAPELLIEDVDPALGPDV